VKKRRGLAGRGVFERGERNRTMEEGEVDRGEKEWLAECFIKGGGRPKEKEVSSGKKA